MVKSSIYRFIAIKTPDDTAIKTADTMVEFNCSRLKIRMLNRIKRPVIPSRLEQLWVSLHSIMWYLKTGLQCSSQDQIVQTNEALLYSNKLALETALLSGK